MLKRIHNLRRFCEVSEEDLQQILLDGGLRVVARGWPTSTPVRCSIVELCCLRLVVVYSFQIHVCTHVGVIQTLASCHLKSLDELLLFYVAVSVRVKCEHRHLEVGWSELIRG